MSVGWRFYLWIICRGGIFMLIIICWNWELVISWWFFCVLVWMGVLWKSKILLILVGKKLLFVMWEFLLNLIRFLKVVFRCNLIMCLLIIMVMLIYWWDLKCWKCWKLGRIWCGVLVISVVCLRICRFLCSIMVVSWKMYWLFM